MVEETVAAIAAPRGKTARAFQIAAIGAAAEAVLVPLGALAASLLLFGVFVAIAGVNPAAVYGYMVEGSVGSWFSVQNTLTRAAPLILTGLCTALPAQVGLMIIGGEGAFVIGGLCAAVAGVALLEAPALVALPGDGGGGHRGGRGMGRPRRRLAPLARGQRDDFEPPLELHRDRHFEPAGRRGVSRPEEPQPAVLAGDRRRPHDRDDARHRNSLGAADRHHRLRACLRADPPHDAGICRARRRRQSAGGAHGRTADRQARHAEPAFSAGRRPASPA